MKKPGYYYSGDSSHDFWDRVWRVKPKAAQDVLFLMGCALQDHEERMHQALLMAENGNKASKAKK